MAKVVTLGEIMLRLSPPGYQRFMQAAGFHACYGGAEANVAGSLAQLGHQVSFLTKVPANALGNAAVHSLQSLGIDCSHVAYGGNRLGIYFLENGASVRPSSVIYDRADSSFAQASVHDFDFDAVFRYADLFHLSGISPVLSPQAGAFCLEAVKKAKEHNLTISFDLNFRSRLWTSNIPEKQRLLSAIISYADICFGNPRDAANCLGYSVPGLDFIHCEYKDCISEEQLQKMADFYHLDMIVTTQRDSVSASDNGWSARLYTSEKLYTGAEYQLHIVDRVGGGDSFAAGVLHGYLKQMSPKDTLEFGIATAALKHTIPGDMNYISESEVFQLIQNQGTGRVQR